MSDVNAGKTEPVNGRQPGDRLDSWKEIAGYLKRDISTVQRWEKLEGLPVHRHVHQRRGSAFAYRAEIDAWWAARSADLQRAERQPAQADQASETGTVDRQAGSRALGPLAWIGAAAAAVVLTLLAVHQSRDATPPRFQAAGHRLLSDFPQGAGSPSFSPDGSMVAFHRADLDAIGPTGGFQIWVKNASGGTPLQLTFDDASSVGPSWSPKGDQILFSHRRGIWSVSALGGTPRLVIEEGWNPRFSADGNQIVFEDPRPGRRIWIANADGTQRRQVAEMPAIGIGASPTLSPDGRSVAFFLSTRGSLGDIWVVPVDGGRPRQLTFDGSEAGGPVWTPDGRSIIFFSSRSGSQTLWRIPANGGTPEPVTVGAGQDRDPDISRDGQHLVYTNFRITRALIIHDLATGEQRELLQRRHTIEGPRFSPDGSRLAFSQQVEHDVHVFVVAADGKELRQVTKGTGQWNLMPHWSPDAAWLYFLQRRPVVSLRKIEIVGGDSSEVGSLGGASEAEIDPLGRSIAYQRLKDGQPDAMVIRSLDTGTETALGMIVNAPRWSPDAETIVGWQPVPAGDSDRAGKARVPSITSCSVSRRTCRVLVEGGVAPVISPDGLRILFVRPAAAASGRELWSVQPDGRNAESIALLRAFAPDTTFDVSRHGEVVFVQLRETRAELWQADLP